MSVRNSRPAFYFDFASPECYLVDERILGLTPVPCEWRPVCAADLAGGLAPIYRETVETATGDRGMQPVRWPGSSPV